MGSELQEANTELRRKDSELQQKETELQATQRKLVEVRERADMTEATLGSERIAFGKAKGSLEDDLDQALIAKDTVEAHTKTKTDQCQWEMKVFKFKKYNDGYEDGK